MNTSCSKEWTRKHLVTVFTKAFVNGPWKKNREKILFDREIALMPDTQPLVEAEIIREENEKRMKHVKELNSQIACLHIQKEAIIHLRTDPDSDTKIKEILDTIFCLSECRDHLQAVHKEQAALVKQTNNKTPATTERRVFVRACPDENCRGFLSTQWRCGLCEQYSCPDCHVVKGRDRYCEHQCNPDDVATAKLISKDTKPCPNCRTGIFKIDGCDQMWCTQCRTAFSWRTGNIETKMHNPHYYEWVRLNNGGVVPREQEDNPCGGRNVLQHTIIGQLFNMFLKITGQTSMMSGPDMISGPCKFRNERDFYLAICKSVQNTLDLREVFITKYQNRDQVEANAPYRVKYMRNKITTEEFQAKIQQANKKYEKNREIYDVLQMLVTTATDIIHRTTNEVRLYENKSLDKAINTFNELNNVQAYVNECLSDIANTYSSRPINLDYYNNFKPANI
jgi:hypothetical protein